MEKQVESNIKKYDVLEIIMVYLLGFFSSSVTAFKLFQPSYAQRPEQKANATPNGFCVVPILEKNHILIFHALSVQLPANIFFKICVCPTRIYSKSSILLIMDAFLIDTHKPCPSRTIPTTIIVKMVRTLDIRNKIFRRLATCTLIELIMTRTTKKANRNQDDDSLKVNVQRALMAIIFTSSSGAFCSKTKT